MESILILTAEIAIGLAGFSGVVVAFVGLENIQRRQNTRDRLSSLLSFSGVVVFASLGPLIAAEAGPGYGPSLWLTSSIIWVVINTIATLANLADMIKHPPVAEHRVERWIILAISGLPVPVMVLNALYWQAGAPYLYVLATFIGLGFYEFSRLIMPGRETPDTPADP